MKLAWALAAGVACVALAGCGSATSNRTPLQGKVTYEGKPVAYGMVLFTPDAAKGNKGVFGTAEVVDGAYQTSPDYGPSLGPILVTVQVYNAQPPDNKLIANVADFAVEIPPGTANWDFNLTAKDVKPIRQ